MNIGIVFGCGPSSLTRILTTPVIPPDNEEVEITAILLPETTPIHAGQSIADMQGYAQMISPQNFTSSAGSISQVEVIFLAEAEDAVTVLDESEVVAFDVVVTDSQGNSRIFMTEEVITKYKFKIISTDKNEAQIVINPLVADTTVINLTIEATQYAGTYRPTAAELRGPGPHNFAQTVHISANGGLETGDLLMGDPGLWASLSGDILLSHQWLRDGVAIQNAVTLQYNLISADRGSQISFEAVASDGTGYPVIVFSNEIAIPASEGGGIVLTESFSDVDGQLVTAHSAETGQSWEDVGNGSTVPVISDNSYAPSGGGQEAYAVTGVNFENGQVTAIIDTGVSGTSLGPMMRQNGFDAQVALSCYYVYANRGQNKVLLRRLDGAGQNITIQSQSFTFADSTEYQVSLRCDGSLIEVAVDGTTIISLNDSTIAGPGSVGLIHYAPAQMRGLSLIAEQF